jgi:hypothetical protein
MTQAEKIINVCHQALDAGPMGCYIRRDAYKTFTAKGFANNDISVVKTSCAVFVGSVLHWAGRPAKKPSHIGQGIFNGWLEGLSMQHAAWEDAVDKQGNRRQPPPGGIFYRAYSKASPGTESHVGIFIFETTPGMWFTAEGGGGLTQAEAATLTTAQALASNGTMCRLSAKPKDPFAKDSLGRVLVGWFRPELLDGFTGAVTVIPSATPVSSPTSDEDAIVSYTGRWTKEWQRAIGVKPDGKFGKDTLAASLAKMQKG